MAALPAGVQYGLSSEPSNKENKELFFFKLTDSALKAIQDFLRNNRVSKIAILLHQNKDKQTRYVSRHTFITLIEMKLQN